MSVMAPRDGERIFRGGNPLGADVPAAQLRRVAHDAQRHLLVGAVGVVAREHQRGRVEPRQRVVEVDDEVLLGVDFARGDELPGEGVLLGRRGPLLARLLGLALLAFELFALALLGLGLDEAPCELQILGHLLQLADGVVLEVGDGAADGVGKRLGGHVEPQRHRIAPHGLGVDDDPLVGDAVEVDAHDARVGRGEVEHRLVLERTGRLGEHLAAEGHVGEHAEVELRLGRHVAAQRVVPDGEVGQLERVLQLLDEAHLVDSGFVHLVVVRILDGVEPVGDGLEVLGDEDAVGLGPGDDRGLAVEDGRVVLGGLVQRVGRVEPDEALRHGVGLVAVGRVARENHRVDFVARREDVAHRVERVVLVVVLDGAAEVERIGGVGLQRVAQLDDQPASAQRQRRLLLHLRRGEELLLLVLDLDELVEADVDFHPLGDGGYVARVVVGRHGEDDRRERILGAARGGHPRGAAAQQRRAEEQQDAQPKGAQGMSGHGVHRCLVLRVVPFSGSASGS